MVEEKLRPLPIGGGPGSTNAPRPSNVGALRAAIFEGRSNYERPTVVPGKRKRGAITFHTHCVARGRVQVEGG